MTDRRRSLLNAAVEQIAANGARGLRIEQVARAAGVSTALIYHHFRDRTTLLISALEHIGDRATAYTTPANGSGRDMLFQVLVDEIQDDPTIRTNSAAWGELRDTAIFDEALRPTITRLTQRWVYDIAEIVRAGHADATIAAGHDPEVLGVRLSMLVEGVSARWLTAQLSTTAAREHLAALISAVLDGPNDPDPKAMT